MKKTPLYFNFVGSQRDMLDRAIESYERIAGDLLDIRVHYSVKPRKFTTCLNEILKINNEPYMFAHYDSVLLDRSAIENILAYDRAPNTGIVGHCDIVDLLMLVVPDVLNRVGGWDETFSNSWMDLDLYSRMSTAGFNFHLINPGVPHGCGVDHSQSSTSRRDSVLKYVYAETMLRDLNTFYDRYHSREDSEYIRIRQYIKAEFGV